jgi:hypothetical protein
MRFRFAVLLAVAAALAACATNPTRVLDGDSVLAKLQTEGKGIVLIHTDLHDRLCNKITADVAHPDSEGRFVEAEQINLMMTVPGQPQQPNPAAAPAAPDRNRRAPNAPIDVPNGKG